MFNILHIMLVPLACEVLRRAERLLQASARVSGKLMTSSEGITRIRSARWWRHAVSAFQRDTRSACLDVTV